jgi:hypothetical protein
MYMKFVAHSSDSLKKHVDDWLASFKFPEGVKITACAQSEHVSDRGIREITLSVFYEKRDDFDPLLDDIE